MKKAGARYRASGDGSTKNTTATPENANPGSDLWNGSGGTVPGQTGSAASLTTKTLDDITVTGLANMLPASEGRYLTLIGADSSGNNGSFQIVKYLSSSSVVLRNASAVASDANNGSISWTETDPTLESYPTGLNTVAAWWVCELSRTVRIPVTLITDGPFVRGEKVVQANTGAEGELVGIAWDNPNNSYAVILPRRGTFSDAPSDTFTGSFSNAVATPSGAALATFVEEFVIAKTTDRYNGWLFTQRIAVETENTQRFSYLAHNASGCTATVAPGNGGTGNGFPTVAFTLRGNAASTSQPFIATVTSPTGSVGDAKISIVATHNFGTETRSPDPSFWMTVPAPGLSTGQSIGGIGHFWCEDTDPGDVDPVIWFNPVSSSGHTRTSLSLLGEATTWSNNTPFNSVSNNVFQGWRRRGFSTGDSWIATYRPGFWRTPETSNHIFTHNPADPEKPASYPGTSYFVRDPMLLASLVAFSKTRKGRPRWMFWVPTGSVYDLWEGKQFLQVCPPDTFVGGVVIGPWDGSTNPIYVLWPRMDLPQEEPGRFRPPKQVPSLPEVIRLTNRVLLQVSSLNRCP